MKSGLVRSRFRGVYLGLFLLWVTACLAGSIVVDEGIAPALALSRVEAVESMVRSHSNDLVYNNHRALRDELLRAGVLTDDRNFDELRPGAPADKEKIKTALSSCRWVTHQSCVSGSEMIIFGGMGSESIDLASFAVVLKTAYFKTIPGLVLWQIAASLALALLLGVVAVGIRAQEKFLLGKISLLTSSLSGVDALFQAEGIAPETATQVLDEFSIVSNSLKAAGTLLKEKTGQIESYKREFERKTKLEQLAQTIGYSSHELMAPLFEGAQFLADLPDFMESMPREKLLSSARSLEERLRAGAEAFQSALNATRDANIYPEPVVLGAFLESFRKRVEAQPYLKDSRLQLTLDPSLGDAKVNLRRQEMESALWNLIRNSIEARRDAEIRISAVRKSDALVVSLSDNGPGVPALLLERVFDEYFTTKVRGSGVGLSIVRQGVERSGGTIRALPSSDGAHFEIQLPLTSVPVSHDLARAEVDHA